MRFYNDSASIENDRLRNDAGGSKYWAAAGGRIEREWLAERTEVFAAVPVSSLTRVMCGRLMRSSASHFPDRSDWLTNQDKWSLSFRNF